MRYVYVIIKSYTLNKEFISMIDSVFSTKKKAMERMDAIKSLANDGQLFYNLEHQHCIHDVTNNRIGFNNCYSHIRNIRHIIVDANNRLISYSLERHALDIDD